MVLIAGVGIWICVQRKRIKRRSEAQYKTISRQSSVGGGTPRNDYTKEPIYEEIDEPKNGAMIGKGLIHPKGYQL